MQKIVTLLVIAAAAVVFFTASPAWAADGEGTTSLVIDIVIKYLLLALIFEAVYAAIFEWKMFIKYFNETGAKTVIKVGLAWGTIASYPEMNIINEVATKIFGSTSNSQTMGQFVTALLVAGGSSAIYDIMSKYLRDTKKLEKKIAKIEEQKRLAAEAAEEG